MVSGLHHSNEIAVAGSRVWIRSTGSLLLMAVPQAFSRSCIPSCRSDVCVCEVCDWGIELAISLMLFHTECQSDYIVDGDFFIFWWAAGTDLGHEGERCRTQVLKFASGRFS